MFVLFILILTFLSVDLLYGEDMQKRNRHREIYTQIACIF